MLIMVDGIDRSGKSTLATAISERFGFEYFHFSKPGIDPAKEYAQFLLNLDKPTVVDRFYLGEFVYGPLLRGINSISPLQRVVIERLCRLQPTILIQALTDIKVANARLRRDASSAVTVSQNRQAAKAFVRVIRQANLSLVIPYNGIDGNALAGILDKLAGYVGSYTAAGDKARAVCSGMGTIMGPKIVMVGEQVNQNTTWLELPFDRGFASEFLLDTITKAGIDEKLVYVCNADRLRSAEREFLASSPTLWVALGAKADARLHSLGIHDHVALPHPQFIKRFKWKTREEYVTMFKQIKTEAVKGLSGK